MSKEKRSVPKLRFPGFTEDWEQRKFSEITYLSGIKNKENKPYESYSISNEFGFIPQNEQFEHGGTMKTADKSMYYIVTQNSFAYNPARINVGSIGYYDKPDNVIVSSLYEVFKTTEIVNDKFLWHWFKSNQFNHLIEKYQEGGVRLYFYYDKLCKGAIELPTIDEQNKISNLLNGLDLFITLHQRKLEHLNLKKKALLQKLFPKNGERYPELRFPGFTDAWEQRKLGSIGSTYTGLSGKTKEDFGHGEAQYITYLNVFQNTISDITMTDKVEIDTTQNEVKYGDVLFTTSSETPEEVGMSSVWLGATPNIYLNSFCFGFRPNQKIDPYFLGYSLRAPYMRDKIKILAQGISRYNISKNKVMELEISLPNNEEQKLLGTFLQRIDLIITLHQRKLEHLQLQKKALLQQMFV